MRPERSRGAAALLAGLLVLAAAPVARAEFAPIVAEVPESTTSGSIYAGSHVGFTGVPTSFLLGHAYDYSLTGPLHLDLGTYVGLYRELLVLRGVPGVRYDLLLPEYPFLPYGKAGLAVDLYSGDAAGEQSLGVGLRLAAGLRHFFAPDLGLGVELAATLGATAGDHSAGACALEGLVAFEYRLE